MDREQEIDYVLGVLSDYWHANPNLRLTQLLWNFRPVTPVLQYTVTGFYNMSDRDLADKLSEGLTRDCR